MQRNLFTDSSKGLLIFLVVIGHAIEPLRLNHPALYLLYGLIYSFHMPLFIFIAGQHSRNLDKQRHVAYTHFLVPYIVLNTLWYAFTSLATSHIEFSLLNPGWVLWFLLSMFFWKIMIEHLAQVKHLLTISLLLALACGFLSEIGNTLAMSRTLVFFFFFALGYSFKQTWTTWLKAHTSLVIALGLINLALIMAVLLMYFYTNQAQQFSNMFFMSSAYKNAGFGVLHGVSIRFCLMLSATISILAWIAISFTQNKACVINKIGENSLTIFIGHAYIIYLTWQLIGQVDTVGVKGLLLFAGIILSMLLYHPALKARYDKLMHRVYTTTHIVKA